MSQIVRTNPIPLVEDVDIPLGIRELETRIRALNANYLELVDGGGGIGGSTIDGFSGGTPSDSFGTSGGITGGAP